MKIKRILSLIAAATMAVTALTGAMTVSAETVASGTCGSKVTWTLDSDGVLTISGEGKMSSPGVSDSFSNIDSIKSQIKDYPDTYTYKTYAEDIKEVVIDEGVTSIGVCAFYQLPNLETVVLPSTISEFKGVGFACKGREPATAGKNIDDYASYAFAECTNLKNLTLTEGMTHIGAYAFYGCTSLESVQIPKSITNWGVYTFSECSSLRDITLTEGLTIMGSKVFSETAVESVVIPSTIETWNTSSSGLPVMSDRENANCAFDNCNKLSSVTFADGLKEIGKAPFAHCSSLKKVAIPASLTDLDYALSYCTGLQEVYIEDGAQIKKELWSGNSYKNDGIDYAFYNCENLKKLEIPEGIDLNYTNPQWNKGCNSLTDIYVHNKNEGWISAGNDTSKIHCYFDTTTHNTLLKDYASDRFVDIEQEIKDYLDFVKTNVDKAKTYDEELYTPESYAPLKALIEKAESFGEDASILAMEWTISDITSAIKKLEKKPEETSSDPSDSSDPSETSSDPSETSSDPSSDNSSNPSDDQTQPTSNTVYTTAAPATTAPTTTAPKATTANNKAIQAAKDKANAEKVMKQAKITKLTAKAKGKKKIVVSWKKVSKAKGYNVQVSNKKTFKKILVDKTTSKVKLTIKSNKIKSKKTYYVRVRAYATYKDANGKTQKVYSSWIKKTRKVKAK